VEVLLLVEHLLVALLTHYLFVELLLALRWSTVLLVVLLAAL
jgi:hypothetical protein